MARTYCLSLLGGLRRLLSSAAYKRTPDLFPKTQPFTSNHLSIFTEPKRVCKKHRISQYPRGHLVPEIVLVFEEHHPVKSPAPILTAMSSPNPPIRKHHNKATPRRFTDEQVRFVLDRARTDSNKDIMTAFNRHFEGVRTLELHQVKYIRTTYGHWSAPNSVAPSMMNPMMDQTMDPMMIPMKDSQHRPSQPGPSSQPCARFTPIATSDHSALEEVTEKTRTSSNHGVWTAGPEALLVSSRRLVFGPTSSSVCLRKPHRHEVALTQPPPPMLEQNFPDLPTERTWHEGTHDDCEIDAQHRHNPDDSVFFPSKATVSKALARSRAFVQPEDLGRLF
ncbi:hypothetical protein CONLIGDRAFT_647820 [Coniochaeta ligniaria NRRL 30616]|uniref:Uncharacterized protein n=1 Tax=Coniochaeta ligniaria NRRL 30616 TaxID=1408157 RepID=A0A1J7IEH9_9PEZI|nr:hypothetical protein CONLIGDRAFT_647820 [Coniochaeta ligniaria NRRL 30616]